MKNLSLPGKLRGFDWEGQEKFRSLTKLKIWQHSNKTLNYSNKQPKCPFVHNCMLKAHQHCVHQGQLLSVSLFKP